MPFNPAPVKGLLFDLDGTLVDSTADLVASGNHLRAQDGLPSLDAAVVATYIGDGVEALVRRLLVRNDGDVTAQVEAYMLHYRGHCLDHTRFYAGVEPTLRVLAAQGRRMAVVTNKPEMVSRRILEGLGVALLFGVVVGGNTCRHKKPHAEPVLRACAELGVDVRETLMIGDSRVDVEAGRNAGLRTVGILGGIGDQSLLKASEPDVLIENFECLLPLMER